MRARWLLLLLAAPAPAQEGEGAPGKGEDPHAALVKRLRGPEAEDRAKAARTLGRAPDERAVPFVRAVLEDPDAQVRAAAAVALVRLGAPDNRVLDVLVTALKDPEWYTRWEACVALGTLGPLARPAAPALLAAAGDKDLDIARDAANALLRMAPEDPQVCAGLARLLDGDAAVDRRQILRALEGAGQIPLATDWLAKELVSNRHGLRGMAAALLGKCGVKGLDALAHEARHVDPWVRWAIYHLDREEKIGPAVFVDALADAEPEVRRVAINALARRKAADAAPAIANRLADEDADVRLAAARALADLGTPVPDAGPALVRMLAEGDVALAQAALRGMGATGFAALATFLECRSVPGEGGIELVWVLHPGSAVDERPRRLDELVAALEDNRRGAALVEALREALAREEDRVLVAALGSEDAMVRRASAVLLGRLARDRTAAILALRIAARDRDDDVRAAAEQALERLRSAER